MKAAFVVATCLVVWILFLVGTLAGLRYAFASMGIRDPWGPAAVLTVLCSLVWAIAVARAGYEAVKRGPSP